MDQIKVNQEKKHNLQKQSIHKKEKDRVREKPFEQEKNTKSFVYWLDKNSYYHSLVKRFYRALVPEGMRVLHINGKNGYILDVLKPSFGVCLDDDKEALINGALLYPHYHFYYDTLVELPVNKPFDYILLSLVTMEIHDIQKLLQELHQFCNARTRIIIESYSHLWEPALLLAQKLGLRRATTFKNWFSPYDLRSFLNLAEFEVVTTGRYMLFPLYIPLLSSLCNGLLVHLPLIKHLSLHNWVVARPSACQFDPANTSVSVIIPCKNEKGTIEQAIQLCPQMGKKTELIFVEGGSTDGTLEEIKRAQYTFPEKSIQHYKQKGIGKSDAVRLGCSKACGDIIMILDADLTVPPQELQNFFNALISGKGEFINGSRLVYRMESRAMGIFSMLANFFFSKVLSWLLGQQMKDTLCGTKVLWRHHYEWIAQHRASFCSCDPFGDFDLLFGATRLQLKIIDLPVHYKNRIYGKTAIRRFLHGLILCRMCLIAFKKFKLWRF
jgi:hypothetical protein